METRIQPPTNSECRRLFCRHANPFFGSAGKITRISLTNFCNHESLEWEPSPHANLILGCNGHGKSALAKAIFICCGAERSVNAKPMCEPENGGDKDERADGKGISLGEKIHLYQFVHQYWEADGPSKATVSLTFSNFSTKDRHDGVRQRRARTPVDNPSCDSHDALSVSSDSFSSSTVKEEDASLISKVSYLTGDDFVPIDRAYHHRLYGDFIVLTREIVKKRREAKGRDVYPQARIGPGSNVQHDASWTTGRATWFISGLHQGKRQEVSWMKVQAMLSHFNLNVSNPAVYLSQELAKTFLFRATPESLYAFYKRANGLSTAHETLVREELLQEKAALEMAAFRRHIDPIQQEIDEVKKKLNQLREYEEMVRELQTLEALLPQVELREARCAAEACAAEVAELEQKLRNRDHDVSSESRLEDLVRRQKEDVDLLNQRLVEFERQRATQRTEKKHAEDSYKALVRQKNKLEQELDASRQMVAAIDAMIENVEKSIASPTNDNEADDAAKLRAEVVAAEESLRAALAEHEKKRIACTAARLSLRTLRERESEFNLKEQAAKASVDAETEECKQQEQIVLGLRQRNQCNERRIELSYRSTSSKTVGGGIHEDSLRRGDLHCCARMNGDPANLRNMRQEIDELCKQCVFSTSPVGPIGEYLCVQKSTCEQHGAPVDRIHTVIEQHLLPHMHVWLTANLSDQKRLSALFQRHNRSQRICVINFNAPSYDALVCDEKLGIHNVLTMYKALNVQSSKYSDDADSNRRNLQLVLQYLIDAVGVERVAIVENAAKLHVLFKNEEYRMIKEGYDWTNFTHIKRFGRGVEGLPTWRKRIKGSYGVVRRNYIDDASDTRRARRKCTEHLTRNSTGDIPRIGETIRQREQMENSILIERRESLRACCAKLQHLSQMTRNTTEKIIVAQTELEAREADEIRCIENVQERREILNTIRRDLKGQHVYTHVAVQIQGLVALRESLQRKLNQKSAEECKVQRIAKQISRMVSAMEDNQRHQEDCRKRLVLIQCSFDEAHKASKDGTDALVNLKDELMNFRHQKNLDIARSESWKDALERAKMRLTSSKARLAELRCVPSLDPASLPAESLTELLEQKSRTQQRLKLHVRPIDPPKDLRSRLSEASDLLTAAQARLAARQREYMKSCQNAQERRKKYIQSVEYSAKETKHHFKEFVEGVLHRKANLLFDHQSGSVHIQTADSLNNVASGAKALSGGEKSSVQIALLASLARSSESPVHIFDELDVFMDEHTRMENFHYLLDMAVRMRECSQFFFITPHCEIRNFIRDRYPEEDVQVLTIKGLDKP